jgi:hypothetical protein
MKKHAGRLGTGLVVFLVGAGVAFATVSPNAVYRGGLSPDAAATVDVTVNSNATTVRVYYTNVKLHCPDPSESFREDLTHDIPLNADHTFTGKTDIAGGRLVTKGKASGKKATGTLKATASDCSTHLQDWVALPI